jgi:hypothetical protein
MNSDGGPGVAAIIFLMFTLLVVYGIVMQLASPLWLR